MSDNNGWPGKPGVPLNPERDGWHWIKSLTTGGLMCAEWRADRMGWNLYRSTSEHHAPNEMFSWGYLGPCLTPAEVDARVKQARRDALEEAARVVEMIAEWGGQDYYCESCKGGVIYPDRTEVAATIRALGEKE
jgi:hypothetical protein